MKNQHPASVRAGRPGRAALTAGEGLTSLLRRLHTEERGDVPGWVMITFVNDA
ncbi:hypothetical protein [Nesterenkonia sp. K-15-9-6]|uniref:hypothetical protein n=1 Tax=Nesterenkonia sp. K-15-9-6 TaxID=3093918 RepID=UPI004045171A